MNEFNTGSPEREHGQLEPRPAKDTRKVFVVHGRNLKAREAMFAFLRSINLDPIEWGEARHLTGDATPYIGQILDSAFEEAQAVVVLITGDDVARIGTRYATAHDAPGETDFTPQARPNVLFEAGMALGRHPERTVLVELGETRPFSDVFGRHTLRISNQIRDRQDLADRLRTAGCAVVIEGRTDWHAAGDFDATLQSADVPNAATSESLRGIRNRIGITSHRKFLWWAAGIAVLFAVLELTAALFRPGTSSDVPKMKPFATESQLQAMPRWSPKSDRVAYSASVDGILEIFTKSLDSAAPTQITEEKESCVHPFWSADGKRIYYLVGRRPNTRLRSVAVGGGEPESVLGGVYRADLSPDGKTLAALSLDSKGSYYLSFSTPPGTQPKPYSSPGLELRTEGVQATMHFTADGKYLGFSDRNHSPFQFWKIPIGGGRPEEMLHGKGEGPANFAWLKNDESVVTDSFFANSLPLSVLNFRSGTRRLLTTGIQRAVTPSLSPDGKTLAFAIGEFGYDIIRVPLDGTIARDVLATAQSEVSGAWHPDGLQFAYVTYRTGTPEIWLRNYSDGSEKPIVSDRDLPGASELFDCEISPDGRRLAYRARIGADVSIWISPLTGERPRPVQLWEDPDKAPQRGPSWSPDGNWIAYYVVRRGKTEVVKSRVGADTAPESLAFMATPQPVRWSPKGDWIAFRDGDKLRIISPDGKVNRVVSNRAWETYGWGKDGTMLYGLRYSDGRRVVLAAVDVANPQERAIADLGTIPADLDFAEVMSEFPYRGFSIHPDGKSFLTSIMKVRLQIYLMKDFDSQMGIAGRKTL